MIIIYSFECVSFQMKKKQTKNINTHDELTNNLIVLSTCPDFQTWNVLVIVVSFFLYLFNIYLTSIYSFFILTLFFSCLQINSDWSCVYLYIITNTVHKTLSLFLSFIFQNVGLFLLSYFCGLSWFFSAQDTHTWMKPSTK